MPRWGLNAPTPVVGNIRPQHDVRAAFRIYDEPMLPKATAFGSDRVRRCGQLIPAGYSWSFILLVDGAIALSLVASTFQRSVSDRPVAAVAAALALAPIVLFYVAATRFMPSLVWATSFGATTILLFATSTPIAGDFAPALLVVALGAVVALVQPRYGLLALGSAVSLLVFASAAHRLGDAALYLGMAVMGWLMGLLTRMQAQLLVQQRAMQADLAQHAAAEERRRIAREVHDVIAHSLSITLLHVTGARRALEQDRDVDDAIDALTDAERLGRQAMADIRRTVGLLDAAPRTTAPEPAIADLPDLVKDYQQAGMNVTLASEGSDHQISAAVGLAIYRITQESLTNIVKHAPESAASVNLVVTTSLATLSILNAASVATPSVGGTGRGLTGMRQRVELLGGVLDAGPCREGWSVHAEIPLGDNSSYREWH